MPKPQPKRSTLRTRQSADHRLRLWDLDADPHDPIGLVRALHLKRSEQVATQAGTTPPHLAGIHKLSAHRQPDSSFTEAADE
jgi:hypothetical protein